MKFKIWFDRNESVLCEFCGGENLKLLADRGLCEADSEGVFAFYNCSGCGQFGFWTHEQAQGETGGVDGAVSHDVSAQSRRRQRGD